jgi:hypothetical protein
MTMPPDPVPEQPADSVPEQPANVRPPAADATPVLPVRSPGDTDVGWSEPPELDDDERLYRDRPPHWDSA